MMRFILFTTLCVLSFASVSFSALIFGERIGFIPPGQEELTTSTYTLQTDEHKVQVELYLAPQAIHVQGGSFFTVIFGTQTMVLSPGETQPLQSGDSVAVIGSLVEGITKEQIWTAVRSFPNSEALIFDLNFHHQKSVFAFGFKIFKQPLLDPQFPLPGPQDPYTDIHLAFTGIQLTSVDSQDPSTDIVLTPTGSQGPSTDIVLTLTNNPWFDKNPLPYPDDRSSAMKRHERPYDGDLPAAKRHRPDKVAFQEVQVSNFTGNGFMTQNSQVVSINVPEIGSKPSAVIELNNEIMTFMCQGGVQIFIFRDGEIHEASSILIKRFPDIRLSMDSGALTEVYGPDFKSIEIQHGDALVIFLPGHRDITLDRLLEAVNYLNSARSPLTNYQHLAYEYPDDGICVFVSVSRGP
ncbi:hypothetical protein PSACC_00139 [Paramicrosporidium saccamoebae]|uniref:Uncharacterized protein n=1 Tax=Paramicrosporidium saccamoebae TaxID=1246581 RepID=A0A2H9TQL5_9FUNG|nr:hypothetical protein PSACC_00139 [Paramicrosporidium saccamoebae]